MRRDAGKNNESMESLDLSLSLYFSVFLSLSLSLSLCELPS